MSPTLVVLCLTFSRNDNSKEHHDVVEAQVVRACAVLTLILSSHKKVHSSCLPQHSQWLSDIQEASYHMMLLLTLISLF